MFIYWGKHKYKYGLVLSGGGAKGSYQIGAFHALWDLGFADQVTALSGCSIGALNALLFAAGGPELWDRAWSGITYASFFTSDETTAKSKLGTALHSLLEKERGGSREQFLTRPAMFSQAGLASYIRELVDEDVLKTTPLQLYCNAYNMEESRSKSFCMNGLPFDEVVRLVMASSALPVIYNPVEIDGDHYCDGGKLPPYEKEPGRTEKVPVSAIVDAGCDVVIVIYLSPYDSIDLEAFAPGTKVIEIYPSRVLERMPGTGTLDLSPETLASNQSLGYRDTMATAAPIITGMLRGDSWDNVLEQHRLQNKRMLDVIFQSQKSKPKSVAAQATE